jgi:hypothetical protein
MPLRSHPSDELAYRQQTTVIDARTSACVLHIALTLSYVRRSTVPH